MQLKRISSGSKGCASKDQCKRELLNLKSSINYGDARATSRRGKGKAHML
jgi:hypothetical protein